SAKSNHLPSTSSSSRSSTAARAIAGSSRWGECARRRGPGSPAQGGRDVMVMYLVHGEEEVEMLRGVPCWERRNGVPLDLGVGLDACCRVAPVETSSRKNGPTAWLNRSVRKSDFRRRDGPGTLGACGGLRRYSGSFSSSAPLPAAFVARSRFRRPTAVA